MSDYGHDNPFYHNYLFSEKDMKRARISLWDYPFLIFKTTYVQIEDGYVFRFKLGGGGEIYLMSMCKQGEEEWS